MTDQSITTTNPSDEIEAEVVPTVADTPPSEKLEADLAALRPAQRTRARSTAESQLKRRRLRADIYVQPTEDGRLNAFSEFGVEGLNKFAMLEAAGTTSTSWLNHLLKTLAPSSTGDLGDSASEVAAALTFIQGAEPKSEVEAALAAQMFAVHSLTMDTVKRARASESVHGRDLWLGQVSKLARTFAAQAETLSKLKTGGQQTMTVQHIDARGSQNVIADRVVTRGGK